MTNLAHGQRAEEVAADYLAAQGYEIIERNWRTRVCEIDIIASKDRVMYFIEVKYRKSNSQGSGLDYITPKKLKQMQFAANIWIQEQDWEGDFFLSVIEVGGSDYKVTEFLSEL